MISYRPLWDTLKQKNISQYALINTYHVSPAQITRLKRNQGISTHTVDMLCEILRCDISDIMEYTSDDSPEVREDHEPA